MKLTRAADYAIRLLTHLVAIGGKSTSEILSKKIDVPLNHVSKIVQKLSRSGYLITRKGKGGGLRLARNPKHINLAEIVEIIDGPIMLSDCILNKESCCFGKKCKVRLCLAGIRAKMLKVLSKTKIGDLVPTT